MEQSDKIYCSLDIETSGFDPKTCEVLEVGFVFFEIGDSGVKIVEEWTQVFKPSQPVTAQILGLTGISQKELDEAPPFSGFREFLREKFGSAVILGHNVVFDIKFLEGFGIKFSGEIIDTLDLVQWILPTHHSYNLENLMHTFGISHKEAHRALADSRATLKLLEKLLQIYRGFPEMLKRQIQKLIEPHNFSWQSLLAVSLPPVSFEEFSEDEPVKKIKSSENTKIGFNFEAKEILNFPLGQNYVGFLAQALKKISGAALLVVPKPQEVLNLYRQGLVDHPVFLPESSFDGEKFSRLLKKPSLSPEEVKFILKILVWKRTNWQSQSLLDLNLSFFGGQFKSLISGGKLVEQNTKGLLACDQTTFLELSARGLYSQRQVVVCGLNEFESAITANIGTKISWGYINYLLRSFYNFELELGEEKYKTPAREALAAGDLFFGLVNALLQSDPPGFVYYKISRQSESEDSYQKIKGAAENYASKLSRANEIFQSDQVAAFSASLPDFFKLEANRVKWIEISPNRCAFLSQPLDITEIVQKVLMPFPNLGFADCLDSKVLPEFFSWRLGLGDFKFRQFLPQAIKTGVSPKSARGDLFNGVKSPHVGSGRKINYHCLAKPPQLSELAELADKKDALPAAILFAGPLQVREFYDQNYQALKTTATVLAQNNSGGSNKIFRNFSIRQNSLLLCTDKFVLKHLTSANSLAPVSHLKVKTLVLCRLPFDQFTHPYQEALGQTLSNAFEDYSLPKALYNFHSLLKFFYTPELKDIYIIDAKLAKPYAKIFKDYFQTIPNAVFKE